MALPNSLVRNFKNFKIVLSELSLNLAMILALDFFLFRLVGTINRRRAEQKANLMYKCIYNLAQLISVICLSQEHRITMFATRRQSWCSQNQERTFSYSCAILWINLPDCRDPPLFFWLQKVMKKIGEKFGQCTQGSFHSIHLRRPHSETFIMVNYI